MIFSRTFKGVVGVDKTARPIGLADEVQRCEIASPRLKSGQRRGM